MKEMLTSGSGKTAREAGQAQRWSHEVGGFQARASLQPMVPGSLGCRHLWLLLLVTQAAGLLPSTVYGRLGACGGRERNISEASSSPCKGGGSHSPGGTLGQVPGPQSPGSRGGAHRAVEGGEEIWGGGPNLPGAGETSRNKIDKYLCLTEFTL